MKLLYLFAFLFLSGLFACTNDDSVPTAYIDLDAKNLTIGRVTELHLIKDKLIFEDIWGDTYWIDTLQKRLELVCLDSLPKRDRRIGFEDEQYKVYSCCRGEWGGSVFFEDKQTGNIYSTESTCLVNVDTFNGAYYFFDYLGHGRGSSSITKIKEVSALPQPSNFDSDYPCIWYHRLFDTEAYFKYRDSLRQFFLGDTTVNRYMVDNFDIRWSGIEIIHGFRSVDGLKFLYADIRVLSWGTIQSDTLKGLETLTDIINRREAAAFHKMQNNENLFVLAQNRSYELDKELTFNTNSLLLQINKATLEHKIYLINFGRENDKTLKQ